MNYRYRIVIPAYLWDKHLCTLRKGDTVGLSKSGHVMNLYTDNLPDPEDYDIIRFIHDMEKEEIFAEKPFETLIPYRWCFKYRRNVFDQMNNLKWSSFGVSFAMSWDEEYVTVEAANPYESDVFKVVSCGTLAIQCADLVFDRYTNKAVKNRYEGMENYNYDY